MTEKTPKIPRQDKYINLDHEQRLIRLEVVNAISSSTLIRLENKIEQLDKKFDNLGKYINDSLWKNFFWIVGTLIGVLGLFGKLFHVY